MKFVKNVQNLIKNGKFAKNVTVLCPSKLKYDGQSVPTGNGDDNGINC
jgi:hypothetical protein